MKVLVVDFSEANNIVELFPRGLELLVEKKDGGRAYKIAGEEMPDIIIINYKDKPSPDGRLPFQLKSVKRHPIFPFILWMEMKG